MPIPLLLHGRHAPTVTYEPLGDWMVPWRFEAFEPEYEALRTAAGLIDYSHQALIEVRGADRLSFLHQMLTNDLRAREPGTGCAAALLTPTAKVLALLLVLVDKDTVRLLTDVARAGTVADLLEQHHFSEDVAITNHERHFGVFAIQGPRTIEVLTQTLGTIVSLPVDGAHVRASWNGTSLHLARWSLGGEVGVLGLVEAQRLPEVWDALHRQGLSHSLRRVGWEALNAARIEAGVPWWGVDLDDTILLPETGLEPLVASDTKGCYLGQEIVARMATYGSASKRLMALLVDDEQVPAAGDRILREEQECGWVTSACRSPRLRRPLALGYVKRGAYDPGTSVVIAHGDRRVPAVVAERPHAVSGPASSGRTPAGG